MWMISSISFEDSLQAMQKDNTVVVQASYLLFAAHYLERIADHAVNIAERVQFIETGQLRDLTTNQRNNQPLG